MASSDDSGEHPRVDEHGDGEQTAAEEVAVDSQPERPQNTPLLQEPEFQRFGRVIKIFLWPFLFSWALAYVGGARGIDWLHFTGLGGVLICMVALLVWLIS